MEDTLREKSSGRRSKKLIVLILVLMEDTLRVMRDADDFAQKLSLNPCFNGRYSQRTICFKIYCSYSYVLILVLMEDTLRVPMLAAGLAALAS